MAQIDAPAIEEFFRSTGSKIYNTAEQTVTRLGMDKMLEQGTLVGLSGGVDSVMLLCFLLEYRRRHGGEYTIAAAHINHGIRGEEAERDAAFCKSLCDLLGVELITKAFHVPTIARGSHIGIEESARIVRYSAFDMIISGRNDISTLAVAHNMSDSVETVVFNIIRGSGARGASGIRPVRDNIIRPLIGVSKDEIRSYADTFGLPYVMDSTNLSDDYTRNYIRHEVIPSLSRISSDPERMISRFADNMRSDDDFITGVAEEFVSSREVITNRDLASLHYSVYVRVLSVMAAKHHASVSYNLARDIHPLLSKDNFSYSIIGGASFVCERGVCRISRDTGEGSDFCYDISFGINDLSPMNAVLILSKEKIDKSFSNVYKISIQAKLSSAIISGGLYLRSKKDGDTVYYGGMTHKLKKLFSDAKIPRSKRRLIPILCDEKGVLWVPGFGVRDDGNINNNNEEIYVALAITEDITSDGRLYSGSEFRT